MEKSEAFDKLIELQKQLILEVPHGVRNDTMDKMVLSKELIRELLLYVNSCGRKPWRPNPLDRSSQYEHVVAIQRQAIAVLELHAVVDVNEQTTDTMQMRNMTSVFGLVEEGMEYLDNVSESNKLEELTDMLFFYMELVVNSGFTIEQILAEYERKHAENMERYRKGKQGDYSWDKRSEKKSL